MTSPLGVRPLIYLDKVGCLGLVSEDQKDLVESHAASYDGDTIKVRYFLKI